MTTLFIIAIVAVGIIAFIINSRISRTRPDVEFDRPESFNPFFNVGAKGSRHSAHNHQYRKNN